MAIVKVDIQSGADSAWLTGMYQAREDAAMRDGIVRGVRVTQAKAVGLCLLGAVALAAFVYAVVGL